MRLKHAGIGYGAWGRCDVELIEKTGRAEIVAISDEDENNLQSARERHPHVRLYSDWREMLSREQNVIESISVSTRDHMHAPVVMAALQMGKHVYCQKPLSRMIGESRLLTEAARQAGVVTQMGIQIHSHEAYRTAVATIQSGMIGRVREVHVWSRESSVHEAMRQTHDVETIPDGLHWDNWLGAACERPFKSVYLYTWNGWLDFGNGLLGNVGCHLFDPIVSALGLAAPRTISAEVPKDWAMISTGEKQMWPAWEQVRWDFDPTAYTVDESIAVTWYDGGRLPPEALHNGRELPLAGSIWVGEDGTMLLPHIGMPVLLPEEKFGEAELPVQQAGDHYQEYVDSCLGEGQTSCGFDYSGPLTETVLLGMLAVRYSPNVIEWDGATCQVKNHMSANDYLMPHYREGWGLDSLNVSGAVNE